MAVRFGPALTKPLPDNKRAVEDPAFVKHLEGIGTVPAWTTPQEMGTMIRTELARWKKVIAGAGVKPEQP